MSSYFVTDSFIWLRMSFLYLIVGILQFITVNFYVSKFTYSNPHTVNGAFRFTNICIIQQCLTNYIFQVSWAVHFYQLFQTSVFGLVYTRIFRRVWMNMIGGFCRKRLAQPPSLSSVPQSSLWTFDTQLCLKGKQ